MKQVVAPPFEEHERLRREYKALIKTSYHPEQLVFVDESFSNLYPVYQRREWVPAGGRARRRDVFIEGRKFVLYLEFSLTYAGPDMIA